MNSLAIGLRSRGPTEVTFAATVLTKPRFFYGARTHAVHEAFLAADSDGARVQIIDNVALAPKIPVRPGDRITVRGELIAQTRGGPIVHYTHRDPRGAHASGFIEWHGRRFA